LLRHDFARGVVGISEVKPDLTVTGSPVSEQSPLSLTAGLGLGIFLVSVPVLLQAPLVRFFPGVSLAAMLPLYGLAWWLLAQPRRQVWGDLLLGFSWSWLAGTLYWGWMRFEPLWHLPVEAVGLPFALWALGKRRLLVGQCFYLGSLLGTAITDIYFYCLDLLPFWRRLMTADVEDSLPILRAAGLLVKTAPGLAWALLLLVVLFSVAAIALSTKALHWWVFAGAVLGTVFVDALFGASALL
jgi:hypothetical protein